ncbi:hypothetical protein HK101_001933 [Irineochytrium annulatum]|nr:hypothetical protein HK101_001933 [Irineochytrium annulatum]
MDASSPARDHANANAEASVGDRKVDDDALRAVAKSLDPENLRTASNEELVMIMQSLKGIVGSNADAKDSADNHAFQSHPAETERTVSSVGTVSPGAADARRSTTTSAAAPFETYSLFDHRGSVGSLPRPCGHGHLHEHGSDCHAAEADLDSEQTAKEPEVIERKTSDAGLSTGEGRQLRLEVETTLHKTLELEHMLTTKELQSYEAQSHQTEMECARALKALQEAQRVKRERKAELEMALQERHEVQSIIRYLAARIDSLNARIRDGGNRLNALRLMGTEKPAPPVRSSNASSNVSPSTTPPRSIPLSIISSIDRDLDEWDRPVGNKTAAQSEEERLFYKADPDAAINLKRARTTSPADGEDLQTSPTTTQPLCVDTTAAARFDCATTGSPQTLCGDAHAGRPSACIAFQRGQCQNAPSDCSCLHVCIRCAGPHPVILCKKDRNVCVKWNMEAWNSAGTCRIVDCRRLHECIRCGTSHPSIICPENLDNYLSEYIKRRRSEGFVEGDLVRLELQINQAAAAAAAASGNNTSNINNNNNNNNVNSTAIVPSVQNNAVMPMGYPSVPIQTQQSLQPLSTYTLPQASVHPSVMMGMGIVQPHPMHLAAAAAAAAASAAQQQQMRPNSQMGHHHNQQFHHMQQQMQMQGNPQMQLLAAMDMERAAKRLRPDDPHAMVLSGFRGVNGSLLSDAERKTICRDYNNFKCEVEDSEYMIVADSVTPAFAAACPTIASAIALCLTRFDICYCF